MEMIGTGRFKPDKVDEPDFIGLEFVDMEEHSLPDVCWFLKAKNWISSHFKLLLLNVCFSSEKETG